MHSRSAASRKLCNASSACFFYSFVWNSFRLTNLSGFTMYIGPAIPDQNFDTGIPVLKFSDTVNGIGFMMYLIAVFLYWF